jgi:hypothetical protein
MDLSNGVQRLADNLSLREIAIGPLTPLGMLLGANFNAASRVAEEVTR